jgi:hypothetical protein
MYKEDFSNIYALIWAMNRIARGVCDLSGHVSGDLMIDTLSVSRMNDDDNVRYWHVGKHSTWMADNEDQFESSVYVIRYDSKRENVWSIEQIK